MERLAMNNIGTITDKLLSKYGSAPMTIRTEGSVLVIRSNSNETRFTNWELTPVDEIVLSVGNLIRESSGHRVLLNG